METGESCAMIIWCGTLAGISTLAVLAYTHMQICVFLQRFLIGIAAKVSLKGGCILDLDHGAY
jgi:hypothetical protein